MDETAKTRPDSLMVRSVEKAFRVLGAFRSGQPTMGLSQIAAETGLDISATQRFTHTLTMLGYLRKDPVTRQFELTARTLEPGYSFMRANGLLERATPYLQHLSKETEETVNLTVPDDTQIIFVLRFLSRHVLNTDVILGTRLPMYCTAPGVAILSRLPLAEAEEIVARSELRSTTAHTLTDPGRIMDRVRQAAESGYAAVFEEMYMGDASVAAAITDPSGRPVGAVNIAGSLSRYEREEAVARFSPLVIAAAHSISRG